ncbi:MAG TPA: hypothetical protein VHL57_04845 [Flavobacteriales bacterium]|jgi:hypothetical protein|nr:hypothetical protein [Flavobacteriales bacterium]
MRTLLFSLLLVSVLNVRAQAALGGGCPSAGPDATLTLCAGGPSVDLFSQLQGASPGGTWTGPDGAHGPTLDPSTDVSGLYLYTIAAQPPCAEDVAVVSVAIMQPPAAGLNTNATLCVLGPTVLAIDLLNGTPQPGGVWTFGAQPWDGVFNPATHIPGCAQYTLPAQAPCPGDVSTLCISVGIPNPGGNGALALCSESLPYDLSGALSGQPSMDGTWTDPNGNVFDGFMDPSVQPSGVYYYHVTVNGDCTDSSSVVVQVIEAPSAGLDATDTVCANEGPVNMLQHLGGTPDPGGTWSFVSTPHSGVFDPEVDFQGCYTYTVAATAPCVSDASVLCLYVQNCSVGVEDLTSDRIALQLVSAVDAAHPTVSIALPNDGPVRWDVIDVAGRTIQQGTLPTSSQKQQLTLDLTRCATGTYTLRAMSGRTAGYLRLMR